MTRPPIRLVVAVLAISTLLAVLVTLASGAWAPRVGAKPVAASAVRVVPDVSEPAFTAEGGVGTVLLGGYATWYATPGLTAAAGPELRGALGDWRGQWITVESGRRSVTVQITDFCACGDRHGIPTLLDLSDAAFLELAPLSAGVVRVSIEIDPPADPRDDAMRDEVRDPLPATSTEDAA